MVGLGKECFHILTFVIALVSDLDKGQYGRVPVVLERSFADVQYSAHVPCHKSKTLGFAPNISPLKGQAL